VVFSSNRSGNLDLWEVSTKSEVVRRLTEDQAEDWDPVFADGGRHILWSSNRTGHFEIWVADADGTGARQLTHDGVDAENPTPTPDGRWIVYASTNPAKEGLWKIRADGAEATRIVPSNYAYPEVSPDGRAIAFIGQDAKGVNGVYVQDFIPGRDTARSRRPLAGFDPERTTESFGISPDCARVIIASWEQLFSLVMAERVPGVVPPGRAAAR
jgi:eukaryotic-like serine/threonine-protein kinase